MFEKLSARNHNPETQCLVSPSLPALVHSRCTYLMVFLVRGFFQLVCSYLHFKFFVYSDLLFKGIAQLGSLDHGPWIKRLLHYRLIRWALRDTATNCCYSMYLFVNDAATNCCYSMYLFVIDAANNWCYPMYLFVNATVLSAQHSFSL